jgi:acetoacetyl-CoA synthetase
MSRFMAFASTAFGEPIARYTDLHGLSIREPAKFWSSIWDYHSVIGDKGAGPYLVDAERMPGARFFPDATLNFAENLLPKDGEEAALVFWGEEKVKTRVSWQDLRKQVSGVQQTLKELGIAPGDRIGAVLPNMPEAIAAMLGATSLGAVWSSCSPDFGAQGILDRFGQIAPQVLVVCDGYYYNGKAHAIGDKLKLLADKLPSVRKIIVVSYLGQAAEVAATLPNGVSWQDQVLDKPAAPLTFERLAFSHPLYILFSSGTTGAPKCIIQSAGGTLLKHLSEQRLHSDLKTGDRLFYFTTLGWMMWNWLVSGLSAGATLLLYDGSPFHPSGNILFDYAEAEKATHFGTSAKYIDALKKAELRPCDSHDLTSLRVILSTGSPLVPESFDYVYDAIKKDVHLASVSGGTDIAGCFVIGIPTEPVWRGEIQGPALGVGVDVFDDNGAPLRTGKGELVSRNAFPSMPIGFWNDPDGRRYRAAYFERFPNVWHQGDFAEWTTHGGMIIHGRSDATLNPGGVRIGTAEIYRQVEQLPEIQESIVIGQQWENDVRVVLFVILQPGIELDDALSDTIRRRVRSGASPRHVPARIVQVTDIPRTKSGKITELAVRDVVHGRNISNTDALANPEALDLYRDLPELAV